MCRSYLLLVSVIRLFMIMACVVCCWCIVEREDTWRRIDSPFAMSVKLIFHK